MPDTDRCTACGQTLDEHFLTFYDGVAHAGHYDAKGDPRLCSRLAGDADYQAGRAHQADNVARSLKNIAGRLRSKGFTVAADAVRRSADRVAREASELWELSKRTRTLWREDR
jgi:hypothetical protein